MLLLHRRRGQRRLGGQVISAWLCMSPCSSDCIFQALRALSGVQSLRILGCHELSPSHLPRSAAPVHREGAIQEPAEAGLRQVLASSHRPHDARERLNVRVLRREQLVALEERNDSTQKCVAISHDVHQGSIRSAIPLDVATPEPRPDQLEHLSPVSVLADMELRYQLIPDATRRVALHRDREAAFSVHETSDVAIQSFLLIVRTRHVVTIVNRPSDDTMSSAGYSEFPAYSQIYRQRYPLSHDVLNPARVPL